MNREFFITLLLLTVLWVAVTIGMLFLGIHMGEEKCTQKLATVEECSFYLDYVQKRHNEYQDEARKFYKKRKEQLRADLKECEEIKSCKLKHFNKKE